MTGSWWDEPRAGSGSSAGPEQSPFGLAPAAGGEPGSFAGLELAQPFHANFVGLTTEHPPINIPKPRAIDSAPPMFMDGDGVFPLECHDQFSGFLPVAVLF